MGQMGDKLRELSDGRGGRMLAWWCPGCLELHAVPLDNAMREGEENCGPWAWNQSLDRPGFTPSVNVRASGWDPLDPHAALGRCHAVITDGQISFCGDSQHALVCQTVSMPDLPAWHLDSDDPRYRAWLREAHPDVYRQCFESDKGDPAEEK